MRSERRTGLRYWLRDRFWALPLAIALTAAGLAITLTAVDQELFGSLPLLFSGGPEGARALLAAIITSMISFTGLVFSITVVVLQLTSSQFSPRVLNTFLHDRFTQVALGVFVATFVFAFVVLRTVRGTAETEGFVPATAVTAAVVLVFISVLVFLRYIHHITQSIRVSTIINRIATDTRTLIARRYPPDDASAPSEGVPAAGPVHRVPAAEGGVVQSVRDDRLADTAAEHRCSIRLVPAIGEFLPAGATLFEVTGTAEPPTREELCAAVVLNEERTLDQDVGFGLRQLVDIALRALSPSLNDPTTAVQVVDQLHDLLRCLATRPLPPRRRVAEGVLLLTVPEAGFDDLLAVAVDEIARVAADDPRVRSRLHRMLLDLADVARPEHHTAIARMLQAFTEA
ncbi:DUF2254 domain-containing protein [Lentzea sp. NEAU-D7]|uniref:DUF2254 domain-containing protein n=1 Tax=Lentzea sp. NEAU-D7 TaxID=2994667 RepID=UPI00224ADFD4|nr:DUF2254 domain-containing protein [Lentzea sp. NEAU-D7]MCX2948910.1 DUF2254 domain-containing protein [Lentzea sp. NEAU-D7]